MPAPASSSAILQSAADVAPLVRAEADAADAAARITGPVLEALIERRLFRLCIPRALGGEETDLLTSLRIFERVSQADGSAGWTLMIGAGAGLFAGFLERETAAGTYGPAAALIAGSGAPTGRARPVTGGFRVSGRWAYASGAHHATWFTAACVIGDGRADSGAPASVRAVAVPAREVDIIEGTWSVTAMRATDSHDIAIRDRFVPDARTFSVFDDEPWAEGPLYRLPFPAFAELCFASVSLGIARQALDEFRALAAAKPGRAAGTKLADDPDVQACYGMADAAVAAVRARVYEAAAGAWETVSVGDAFTAAELARIRLAAVDCVQRAAEATGWLVARAGMTPLFSGSRLGRAWRDTRAVSQHLMVAAGNYGDAGRALLGDTTERG